MCVCFSLTTELRATQFTQAAVLAQGLVINAIPFNKQQAHFVCRPLIRKRLDLSGSRHRECVYDYASFNGVGDKRKAVSSC
jgi:hypothetical protein